MTINVGTMDRGIRLVIGLALIAAALFSGIAMFDGAILKYGALIIGVVLVGTGLMRTCPAYSILGIKTCS